MKSFVPTASVTLVLAATLCFAATGNVAAFKADADSAFLSSSSSYTYYALDQVKQCPALRARATPPLDINDLRVDDIKVVMALGDSLSAGFGVKGVRANIIGSVYENRGLSWIMGGDEGASTVANFIAQYNPNVVGRSVKDHLAEVCYGPLCPPLQYKPSKDVFNAAQSGALASNLDHELRYLLKELKNNKKIDFANDWKLLNVAIGPNDLCLACLDFNQVFLSPDKFENYIRNIVTGIQNSIPKTIVTLTELFNVSQVFDLSLRSSYCKNVHRILPIECSCAFNESPLGAKTRAAMDAHAQEYNERMRRIVRDYETLSLPEFAVVLQPQFRDADSKNFPTEFLSKVDCFHISQFGAEAMAVAHFNNLFRPVSQKKTSFEIGESIECLGDESRIQTH